MSESLNQIVARAAESPPVEFGQGSPPFAAHYERMLSVLGEGRSLAWGSMIYACPTCKWEHRVWLCIGVEGPPALRAHEAVIPAPFVAGRCPSCDESLSHAKWSQDETWDELRRVPDGQAHFIVPAADAAAEHARKGYGGADYIAPPREPRPDDDEPHLRCTMCGFGVTRGQSRDGLSACPRCGDTGTPMAIADDVEVKVNWHELRILCMWAEQHAASLKDREPTLQRVVNVIAGRLHAQHPERPGLTFTAEFDELRRAYPGAETNFPVDEQALGPDDDADDEDKGGAAS